MCVWIDGGLKLSHTLFLELHFCSKWQNDLLFSLIWTLGKVVTCFQAGCVLVRCGGCGICSSPREDFLCCLPFDHHFSSTLRSWWPSTTCHMQVLWLKVGSDGEVPENPGQTQVFIYLFLFFLPSALFFLVILVSQGWFDVVSFQIDTIKQNSTSDSWWSPSVSY